MSPTNIYIYTERERESYTQLLFDYTGTMADQMAIEGLLECEHSNNCKEMLQKVFKKNIAIVVPALMGISLIISLCTVVSVLHEKQNSNLLDCILKPTFQKDIYKTCPYVDQYPLSNEVYARICVNGTIQIDIRRFYNGNPSNEGIILSQMQWHYLKSSVDHVDESILKSRTHL